MQSDMSLSNDTFTATISNQDAILENLKFEIKVSPLVRCQEAFSVTEKKMPLTQKHLDASHLAGLTNSNPVYFLMEAPNYGKIMPDLSIDNQNFLQNRRFQNLSCKSALI